VAVIGAATALFAATIGVAQNDIKRVLAYSTVSQLGYMFFACGVGAFTAGIFHLMTHAFFKALLFLGAGSVIHALSDEQDLRKMGGLASKLPWTHATMLMGTLAIAGFPPFSGFFSKDEILSSAFASGHYGVWLAGTLAALLTSFYMFRLYFLAFRGPSRLSHEAEHHLHESPWSMLGPLVVLAVLSVVGGFVGLPFQEGGHAFERWLEPVFARPVPLGAGHESAPHLLAGTEWALLGFAVVIATLGFLAARGLYAQGLEAADRARARVAGLWGVLEHKYWVDEIVDAIVVRPLKHISDQLWEFWDARIVDGAVNGVGYVLSGASAVLRLFQTGFVGTYALFISLGVAALLMHFLRHRP
jgi:NADH-quinone oxidoreductase subunit L